MLDTSFMLFHIIAFHVLKGFKILSYFWCTHNSIFGQSKFSLKNEMNLWCECSSIGNRYYGMNGWSYTMKRIVKFVVKIIKDTTLLTIYYTDINLHWNLTQVTRLQVSSLPSCLLLLWIFAGGYYSVWSMYSL
jgi:hypothetical protein